MLKQRREKLERRLMKQNPEAAMRLREWEKALSEGREKTDKTGNIR